MLVVVQFNNYNVAFKLKNVHLQVADGNETRIGLCLHGHSDGVLDNVLGITDVVETKTSQVTLPEVTPLIKTTSEDADNFDYKYQRENFYQSGRVQDRMQLMEFLNLQRRVNIQL